MNLEFLSIDELQIMSADQLEAYNIWLGNQIDEIRAHRRVVNQYHSLRLNEQRSAAASPDVIVTPEPLVGGVSNG